MSRLAFLGSPEAAVAPLRALVDAGHEVDLVVSQPDKRRGRGSSLSASPVKRAALDLGLPVTEKLDALAESGAELGVVVAYGRIIPKRVLDAVPMLNAHFSLLPRWRGAAPVERAILAGDSVTGLSIMRLDEGLDTGPVLLTERVEIDDPGREHASRLTERLSVLAARMLVEVLSGGVAALAPGKAQMGDATYAPKLDPEELRLDFSRPALDLERLVRVDRAWTTFRGERLRVLDARAHLGPTLTLPGEVLDDPVLDDPVLGGGMLDVPGALAGAFVRTLDGLLELIEVQSANRKPVSAADWIRGARPGEDDRLGA